MICVDLVGTTKYRKLLYGVQCHEFLLLSILPATYSVSSFWNRWKTHNCCILAALSEYASPHICDLSFMIFYLLYLSPSRKFHKPNFCGVRPFENKSETFHNEYLKYLRPPHTTMLRPSYVITQQVEFNRRISFSAAQIATTLIILVTIDLSN